jgi:hypothetical protein
MHYKMTEEPICDNENIIKNVSIHTHIHVVIEDLQETHTRSACSGGRRSLKNR